MSKWDLTKRRKDEPDNRKWEYMIIPIKHTIFGSMFYLGALENKLDEFGEDGWEAFSVNRGKIYLKREWRTK